MLAPAASADFTSPRTPRSGRVYTSRADFERRMEALRAMLVAQGRAVQAAVEHGVDAVFERDPVKARQVIENDHEIDRADVQIEREAVDLLTGIAAGAPAPGQGQAVGLALSAADVRMVLTIVKVNNEFERVGDSAAAIAERAATFATMGAQLPGKFRLMANSVIGIMQTTNIALSQMDQLAAQVVLASDDATEAFKQAILRDTLEELARSEHTVDLAQALQIIASNLGRISDHCTNVAEQVIYVVTGKVVRHAENRWGKPEDLH